MWNYVLLYIYFCFIIFLCVAVNVIMYFILNMFTVSQYNLKCYQLGNVQNNHANKINIWFLCKKQVFHFPLILACAARGEVAGEG